MDQTNRVQNLKIMSGLVLLAILYCGLLYSLRTLTGIFQLDGTIGVLLGLYISSHPAKHMVNMAFFNHNFLRCGPSRRTDLLWLLFNLIILGIGWVVIVIGTTRFTVR
ncbi:MAG TPA: hypothetical protein VKF38_16300 [Anaerolineaceae bacterium]|nr:hypothetical protein [Anaerolineaceae bacterium]